MYVIIYCDMLKEIEVVVKRLVCLRCGHKWLPNKVDMPRACPSCHSPYWDIPRTIRARKVTKRYRPSFGYGSYVSIAELRKSLGVTKLKDRIKVSEKELRWLSSMKGKERERAGF